MGRVRSLPVVPVADVALGSALNFFIALMMARELSLASFAAFGVFQTVQGLVQTGTQSGLTDLVLRSSAGSAAYTMVRTLVVQICTVSAILLSGIAEFTFGFGGELALVGVAISMCFWSANRAFLVTFGSSPYAIVQCVLSALAVAVSAGLLLAGIEPGLAWGMYIAIFASLHLVSVLLVFLNCRGKMNVRSNGTPVKWAGSFRLGLEGLLVGGSSQIVTLLAFGRLGVNFTAAYRLVAVVMSPLSLLAPLFNLLLVPHYAKRANGTVRFLMPLLLVSMAVAAYGITCLAVMEWMPSLLGDASGAAVQLLPHVVVFYVLQFGYRLLYVMSRAVGIDSSVARSRVIQIAINISIGALLFIVPSGVLFVWGISSAFLAGLVVLWIGLKGRNSAIA